MQYFLIRHFHFFVYFPTHFFKNSFLEFSSAVFFREYFQQLELGFNMKWYRKLIRVKEDGSEISKYAPTTETKKNWTFQPSFILVSNIKTAEFIHFALVLQIWKYKGKTFYSQLITFSEDFCQENYVPPLLVFSKSKFAIWTCKFFIRP